MSYNIRVKFFNWLKRVFIPHEDNDFSPHALQKTAVVGMMGLVLLSFTVANLQSLLWITSDWMVSTILPAVIIAETNEERSEENLVPLVRNSTLDAAAQLKAEDMAKNEYFAHYSPEGVSPWYWFELAGYTYLHAGENLAVHFTDSSDVVTAWMNSPLHRDNIMNNKYREIGIGTAQGEYEGYPTVYVVQLFGTKQAEAAEIVSDPVVNESEVEQVAIAANESPEISAGGNEQSAVVQAFEEIAIEEIAPEPLELAVETASSSTPLLAVAGDETSDEVPTVTSTTVPVEVVAVEREIEVDDYGAVVYSDHISTSTIGVPASVSAEGISSGSTPPHLAFVTQPHVVLQSLYVVLGIFVAISLVLSIVMEIRRQQPIQIAYGMALMAVMILLFELHINLSSGVLIS